MLPRLKFNLPPIFIMKNDIFSNNNDAKQKLRFNKCIFREYSWINKPTFQKILSPLNRRVFKISGRIILKIES